MASPLLRVTQFLECTHVVVSWLVQSCLVVYFFAFLICPIERSFLPREKKNQHTHRSQRKDTHGKFVARMQASTLPPRTFSNLKCRLPFWHTLSGIGLLGTSHCFLFIFWYCFLFNQKVECIGLYIYKPLSVHDSWSQHYPLVNQSTLDKLFAFFLCYLIFLISVYWGKYIVPTPSSSGGGVKRCLVFCFGLSVYLFLSIAKKLRPQLILQQE